MPSVDLRTRRDDKIEPCDAGNVPPQPAQRTVPLGDQGSEATNASTTDAQIIVTLQPGAVAAQPPDTSVSLTITPLDPATVAPIPVPQKAVSNAYQVGLVYQPSQTPVTKVGNATIALTAATTGETLLYSSDGAAWQETPARPFGNTHGLIGGFAGPGYYAVAAPPNTSTTAAGSTGASGSTGVLLAVAVVGVAAVVVAGVVLRGRRRGAAARSRSGGGGGGGGGRGGGGRGGGGRGGGGHGRGGGHDRRGGGGWGVGGCAAGAGRWRRRCGRTSC